MAVQKITIPYDPRPLQREVHTLLRTKRFGVIVCHRRFGKTVLGVNELLKGSLTLKRERPRFAYIGPTYRQAKSVAWDYVQHYSRAVPGMVPNQSELRCDYPNQGQVRLYGSDNPDSLRGIYLDGTVLDEYGLHPAKTFTEVISATLVDRGGWALFSGTPNGKNQFHEIAEHAKREEAAGNPHWFFREYRASQTGLLDAEYLAQARAVMTEDEYAQEFECSFEAAVKGAIYAKELESARASGRITDVPYDPALPVDTDWDLGMGDYTAIWFSQSTRSGQVRIIDYYEASGEGFPHYAQILRERGYVYGTHWAPHDIAVRELGTGKSRLDTAASYGLTFEITPRIAAGKGEVEDGIHAAKMLFPRCWIDRTKCADGLEALQHYRRDYNARLDEFKATPVHDWACVTGDTIVLTRSGMRQIQSLPPTGEVLTPCGWKHYEQPRITRRHAPLVAVTFDDGLTVRCTPEHRFLTVNGWRFASDLQTGSLIQSSLTRSRSISMAVSIACGRLSATTRAAVRACIGRSGLGHLGRSLMGATSIIETAIRATTRSAISNASLHTSTCLPNGGSKDAPSIFRPLHARALLNGTPQRPAGSGTAATRSAPRAGRNGSENRSRAGIAAPSFRRWFARTATLRNTVPRRARPLRIASVTPLSERADVWCLTVPDGAMWSLANGAVTHNSHSADAFRGLAVRHQIPVEAKREASAPVSFQFDGGWMG